MPLQDANPTPSFGGFGLSDRRKQTNYLEIGEHYIEYWKRRSGALFQVPAASVEINGLTVRVTPEVGLQTGEDHQVLKLWFNAPRLSPNPPKDVLGDSP